MTKNGFLCVKSESQNTTVVVLSVDSVLASTSITIIAVFAYNFTIIHQNGLDIVQVRITLFDLNVKGVTPISDYQMSCICYNTCF